jgi:hypothetical protein
MLLRFHSPGGAKAAFPRSRHGRSSDRDQRCQGCAAPEGLDLGRQREAGAQDGGTKRVQILLRITPSI